MDTILPSMPNTRPATVPVARVRHAYRQTANMKKELYFDVASDEWAAGLYRMTDTAGRQSFYYHYTTADLETGKVKNMERAYPDFPGFWKDFTADPLWFSWHPLYIHPEQRKFIQQQLRTVNQDLVQDERLREGCARQWNKTLNGPAAYYKPRGGAPETYN